MDHSRLLALPPLMRTATVLACGATALLAGCMDHIDKHTMMDAQALHLSDPHKRHAIKTGRSLERLVVELDRPGASLAQNQRADVAAFVESYKANGARRLRVTSPGRASGHLAARPALEDIERIATQSGLHAEMVDLRYSRSGSSGIIELAFEQPTAIAPHCGDWSKDTGRDKHVLPYANFGCATQRNFAKTIQNPRDLLIAQPQGPTSSQRRAAVWKKYIDGRGGRAAATPAATTSVKAGSTTQ